MPEVKWIFFDCMETVVDIIENPDIKLYSWWAYHGCGYEDLWESFDSFVDSFVRAKNKLEHNKERYQEYSLFERFRLMVNEKINEKNALDKVVNTISRNYWKNYKENCYVDASVKNTLFDLCTRFKCGIVSNFMIKGGIEELLQTHGVFNCFDFIVTSIDVGWKKPDTRIYDKAVALAGVPGNQILFVGDNYSCDFAGPLAYGLKAVLLDRNSVTDEKRRIEKISDLIDYITPV